MDSLARSVLAAMIAGLLFSILHAVACITFRRTKRLYCHQLVGSRSDHVFAKLIFDKGQTDRITETFPRIDVPLLSDIPFIGSIFFANGYYIVYSDSHIFCRLVAIRN